MSSSSQVLDQIAGLAQNGAWTQLVAVCEDFELDVANTKVLPFYGIQLFGYLILDNLEAARHLWRRIPSHVKGNHQEIGAIWQIAKQIFIGDTKAMFAAAAAQDWEPLLALLNTKFLSAYRSRTLGLLSKSYENITVASLASQLGLPEDEAQRYATRSGWSYDSATSHLQPGSAAKTSPQNVPLSNLETLTSYVVHLEQQ
jgi:COP9 signalosome complex subunit 8